MNIKYRKFKISDAEVVSELMQNLSKEDFDGKVVPLSNTQKTFDFLLEHSDCGEILLFESGGEIVGYAILINFWSNEYGGNIVDIDELYVKKDFRGKNIGSDFIKYLIDTGFGNAVGFQLEVTPNNKRARDFYKKLGFKKYKNDRFFLGRG